LTVLGAPEPGSHLRIGELSRRSGVSVDLLRAWERRYALLSPSRTPGRYRLYDEQDVVTVARMVRHLGEGISAAQAARMALAEPRGAGAPADIAASSRELREELGGALDDLEEARAQAVLDSLLSRFSLETVLREGVLPHLRELGERWERGELMIGQEHFASAVLRGRLMALARGWGMGAGPVALLACLPGDQHDIALICFGLALRGYGWRIVFLGADTPLDTVRQVAASVRPELVVLSSTLPGRAEELLGDLRDLAGSWRVALAGAGVTGELAERAGAAHLSEDPLDAAATVFRDQLERRR